MVEPTDAGRKAASHLVFLWRPRVPDDHPMNQLTWERDFADAISRLLAEQRERWADFAQSAAGADSTPDGQWASACWYIARAIRAGAGGAE